MPLSLITSFSLQRRSRRRSHSRSRSRSRRRSTSPRHRRRSRSRSRSRSPRSRSRSRSRGRGSKGNEPFARSLGGPINAEHDEAMEMAKVSKRENRVYVGNLSYDVKYRDLMEFMRGGGWGNLRLLLVFGSLRNKGERETRKKQKRGDWWLIPRFPLCRSHGQFLRKPVAQIPICNIFLRERERGVDL